MLRWIAGSPSLPAHLRVVTDRCLTLAQELLKLTRAGAEQSAGMRKLREAKDCFVSAAIELHEQGPRPQVTT